MIARVYQFPRHRLYGRDVPCCHADPTDGDRCPVCAGGLALCAICGGAEGSLPTDCPGCRMMPEVAEAVYAGEVDYSARWGWVQIQPAVTLPR